MLTVVGLLSACVSIFLGMYVLRCRASAYSVRYFALLMAANAVYALAYMVELNAPDLESAVFWLKVEHIGVVLVPVFWFLFSDSYVRGSHSGAVRYLPVILIVPILTLAFMWTNELHGLVYAELRLRDGIRYSVLVSRRGPWFLVNTAYLYALMFFGTLRIVGHVFKTTGIFRLQALLICLGTLIPWLGHVSLVLHLFPYNLDPTPFALTLTGIFLAVGIFKLRLFDLRPIAWERVMDGIRDGVIVADDQDRFVDANRSAKTLFPALKTMAPGADMGEFFSTLPYPSSGRSGAVEVAYEGAAGHRRLRLDSTIIRDGCGRCIGRAVIVADITETSLLMERLERLATTDELTGAVNRRHFMELTQREFDRAKRHGSPTAIALFDLDHFKLINDHYGHGTGDLALVAVCNACRTVLRSSDVLCRYGGEEFLILFPETEPKAAVEIADRLRTRIAEIPFAAGAASFRVSASFGVVGSDKAPVAPLEAYLKCADEAMYRAKELGRNTIFFAPCEPEEAEEQPTLAFEATEN